MSNKPKTIKRMSKMLKALSNEHRLALYLEIAQHQETGIEVSGCIVKRFIKFKLAASTISHHLKELSNADLIHTSRQGKHLVASVNAEVIDELVSFFEWARDL